MADELEKLREKVEKDPNSKLFVSLAEGLKKAGRLDEAVAVLQGGIARQPGYTTARVALGKIYIEKEMKKEAREEFEQVVGAIPDNLYAQRKLAEIYMEDGERDSARKALRVVIKLNPMDEEAAARLKDLEKADQGLRTEEIIQPTVIQPVEVPPSQEMNGVPVIDIPETEAEEKDSVKGKEEIAIEDTGPVESPREEAAEVSVDAREEEEIIAVEEDSLDPSYMEMDEGLLAETGDLPADLFAPKPVPAVETADLLVKNGDYARAVGVLSRILAQAPGDRVARERMAEIKMLIKMLGKGKEVRAARLQGLLGGIRKRRDEFFGNP